VKEKDQHIQRLMRAAFEDAFKLQMGLLYKTYLSNVASVGEDKQGEFTHRGIDNAIEAYRRAMTAVDKWEG
jgi:hypothetical protein